MVSLHIKHHLLDVVRPRPFSKSPLEGSSGCERNIEHADRINRGFEAVAVSPDERWLYVVFQSPLAHPSLAAFKNARHVRIWNPDWRYWRAVPLSLDAPETLLRDQEAGDVELTDVSS